MHQFTETIRAALSRHAGLPLEEVRLETPRDAKLGDLAFPCFVLAKTLKKAPPAIAKELAERVGAELEGIEGVATGPYLNFRIDRALLAEMIITEILERGADYGSSDEGTGRTVVIDLSSPNIAKPMSVAHLRSTVIGAAIQRILDKQGYTTVGINHIGDWGIQFGKVLVAIERWGETVDIEGDPIRALLSLYVRYHDEEEQDPTLAREAAATFQELESGVEGKARAMWRHVTELSLAEFQRIYDRLKVTFQQVRGEAFYEPYLTATVERIEAAGVAEMSEGALVVDLSSLEKNSPPCILRKTDGTTLYATRDLAALFHRWEQFEFARALYVVGGDQALHFRQLRGVLERMELPWADRIEHVAFGLLRLPEGKMSTRKGRVVFLEDVLDTARDAARRIIAEKNPELARADRVAEEVGVGAVVFNDLKRERIKDVEFVLEEVVSFEGDTGPYVQYAHARLASIERKAAEAGEGGGEPDWSALAEADQVLLALGRYPEVLQSAGSHAEPSEVITWLLALCRDISNWYTHCRVLGQEPGVTAARLALVRAARLTIGSALGLIGVAAPEEM